MSKTLTVQRPELGQRVRVTHWLRRRLDNVTRPRGWGTGEQRVALMSYEPVVLTEPIEGVYTGWRIIFNGWNEWEGEEVGNTFVRDSQLGCYLVVTNPRHNPIRVLPEHVEVLK